MSPVAGHVFHNRLTHSLEVAQVAGSIVNVLNKEQGGLTGELGIDEDVVEAAALAHDIGHPPFGHLGEEELDRLVRGCGDDDGFEGNAQTFRIVTKLATRAAELQGLNLCRATLAAMTKYPKHRLENGRTHKKFGAYRSEEDDFAFSREHIPKPERRLRTAEAEIMDWADDIAYSIHDMDDFYRAGLIPLDRLVKDRDGREWFVSAAHERWSAKRKRGRRKVDFSFEDFRQAAGRVLSTFGSRDNMDVIGLVPPALQQPYEGGFTQRAQLRSFTAMLIAGQIEGFGEPPVRLVTERTRDGRLLVIDNRCGAEIAILKALTQIYVLENQSLLVAQQGKRRLIRQLFRWLLVAARSGKDLDKRVFPKFYQEMIEDALKGSTSADATGRCARVVADVISSLTEGQAISLYLRLGGPCDDVLQSPYL